jgi:hypothetical protein
MKRTARVKFTGSLKKKNGELEANIERKKKI